MSPPLAVSSASVGMLTKFDLINQFLDRELVLQAALTVSQRIRGWYPARNASITMRFRSLGGRTAPGPGAKSKSTMHTLDRQIARWVQYGPVVRSAAANSISCTL